MGLPGTSVPSKTLVDRGLSYRKPSRHPYSVETRGVGDVRILAPLVFSHLSEITDPTKQAKADPLSLSPRCIVELVDGNGPPECHRPALVSIWIPVGLDAGMLLSG